MNTRREFCRVCIANAILGCLPPTVARSQFGSSVVYRQDLPAVNLAGWQVTFLELSFPGGVIAASHRHPGFVLGYVLEGKYRFHVEGAPEAVLTVGDVFYEPPGCLHLPSGSASATRPARVLALAFSKKGKELVTPP
jgi:quercetin dioxygenase-like cupin family protein